MDTLKPQHELLDVNRRRLEAILIRIRHLLEGIKPASEELKTLYAEWSEIKRESQPALDDWRVVDSVGSDAEEEWYETYSDLRWALECFINAFDDVETEVKTHD